MSVHAFGWLGRRRHAAEPLTPWPSPEAVRLALRPLDAVAPRARVAEEAGVASASKETKQRVEEPAGGSS
jgi:hypothetical protein